MIPTDQRPIKPNIDNDLTQFLLVSLLSSKWDKRNEGRRVVHEVKT